MQLRQELGVPAVSRRVVDELTTLARDIVGALDGGEPYEHLLAEFAQGAGRSVDISDFDAAAGSVAMETFVWEVLLGEPPLVRDLTDSEAIELVQRIASGEHSDHTVSYWLELLRKSLPCPEIQGLIFWRDLSPEAVVAEARKYKPIQL